MNQKELEKYSRSIIMQDIGIEGQLNIKNAKIFVFGCGGISNGLLLNIASSGVNQVGICDDDNIELSNLQRQYIYKESNVGKKKVHIAKKAIKNINKSMTIKTYQKQLNEDTFQYYSNIIKNYDIIVDTTDNFKTRSLINKLCIKSSKTLFSSSCIGYEIHFYFFQSYIKDNPCYNCIFENPSDITTCQNSGIFPGIASISGNILFSLIMKYIINADDLSIFKKMYVFNFKNFQLKSINIAPDANCKNHK